MILFFIITLVAAYTSRNLLFEQRTSANQYRATLAFEAADAGIEWAVARLNEGRMNDDCTELAPAAAVGAQPSFRQRYLSVDVTNTATNGVITALDKLAGCVFNGTTWICHCPDAGSPAPTYTTSGAGPFPAFWVKFRSDQVGSRPGVVRIQVNACTRDDAACLNFNREAQSGDGLASVWAMVALRTGLPTAPAAALTVRGNFSRDPSSDPIVRNDDATSGGVTIHGGSAVDTTGITLTSLPGTPPTLSVVQNDPSLALPNLSIAYTTPANDGRQRMFNSVFGTWWETYRDQPGVFAIECAGGCDADDVNDAANRHPGHAIYVRNSDLRIDANIGIATAPVLVIVDGNVEFGGGTPTMYGVIYSRAANWQLEGDGTLQGAAMAERNFRFDDDDPQIIYDRNVIRLVQRTTGTFVKIAGSWRDFQVRPTAP